MTTVIPILGISIRFESEKMPIFSAEKGPFEVFFGHFHFPGQTMTFAYSMSFSSECPVHEIVT